MPPLADACMCVHEGDKPPSHLHQEGTSLPPFPLSPHSHGPYQQSRRGHGKVRRSPPPFPRAPIHTRTGATSQTCGATPPPFTHEQGHGEGARAPRLPTNGGHAGPPPGRYALPPPFPRPPSCPLLTQEHDTYGTRRTTPTPHPRLPTNGGMGTGGPHPCLRTNGGHAGIGKVRPPPALLLPPAHTRTRRVRNA